MVKDTNITKITANIKLVFKIKLTILIKVGLVNNQKNIKVKKLRNRNNKSSIKNLAINWNFSKKIKN